MEQDWTPLDLDFSLADASLLSFRLEDSTQLLSVNIILWNGKKINIKFKDLIYLNYQPGDYIKGLYKKPLDPNMHGQKIQELETLNSEFYNLVSLKDIDNLSIIEVVCRDIILEDGTSIKTDNK